MDNKVMYKLSYGLFVLTAKDGDKENGCITNTLQQVTTTPNRVSVTVNKDNFTHDMIMKTGEFNASILSENAVFDTFKHFGFQSGRDIDKFEDFPKETAENGLPYVTKGTCGLICGKVTDTIDLGTHTMFIAEVTDGMVLSDDAPTTYDYYHRHIKSAPAKKASGWVCTICGYVHPHEEMPEDFVCPICKHSAADFEKQ